MTAIPDRLMPPVSQPVSVEEFHGPYGPYQVSELVLQKIWLEQAFDSSRLRDERGRQIEVVHPGRWNRLEGPDFKGAVLRFDGEEVVGDVEVHFSHADWRAHGHDSNPDYDAVALHLLYHDPGEGAPAAFTSQGKELPCACLLPILWYSLEEYAGDDSLVQSTGVDLKPEIEALLSREVEARRSCLIELARRRWLLKRHYAALRIKRLGWRGACHQSALEVMGYARNRVPMLMVAERFSLDQLASGNVDCEALYAAGEARWRTSGCRPANHPKARLSQYLEWARTVPDWPDRVAELAAALSPDGLDPASDAWGTAAAVAGLGVSSLRRRILEVVFGGKIGGSRSDTLVCDALLPLLSAESELDAFSWWFHWRAGDGPDFCVPALRQLQVLQPRKVPMSNGWLQGLLGAKGFNTSSGGGEKGFQAHA